MPIAVGIYLPFGLSTPILLGGLISYFVQNQNDSQKSSDKILDNGLLLSSGLIAGESLMGLLLAFIASLGINNLFIDMPLGISNFLTFASISFVIFWLYYKSKYIRT